MVDERLQNTDNSLQVTVYGSQIQIMIVDCRSWVIDHPLTVGSQAGRQFIEDGFEWVDLVGCLKVFCLCETRS